MAREVGCAVLDVDYRKGPETPFPGAIHDVEDTLRWVASQHSRFDINSVVASGFGAGGCLALLASSSLKQSWPPGLNIPAVVTLYPCADFTIEPKERVAPKPLNVLSPEVMQLLLDAYLPDPTTRGDPLVSPAKVDADLYPGKVVIAACEGDTLAPEANALAKRLDDGRREVVNPMLEDAWHGFDLFAHDGTADGKQRERAYGIISGALREVFGSREVS